MYLAWHQLHLLEEVSLTFSRRATGFHRRAKHFNSNFFMVQAGIIILTACRFTWFSALNETPIVVEWWLFSIESWKVAKYIYLGKVKQEPIRQAVTPICVRGLRGDLTACNLPRSWPVYILLHCSWSLWIIHFPSYLFTLLAAMCC